MIIYYHCQNTPCGQDKNSKVSTASYTMNLMGSIGTCKINQSKLKPSRYQEATQE